LNGAQAEARARSALRLAGPDGWPADQPRGRLRRLPPILLLTAEVDPFRDAAEAFARKMMAAEHEISATRSLGMIHDFSWLPPLLSARGVVDAQCLVACAVRQALSPDTASETASC
jgi:acetyl esterase